MKSVVAAGVLLALSVSVSLAAPAQPQGAVSAQPLVEAQYRPDHRDFRRDDRRDHRDHRGPGRDFRHGGGHHHHDYRPGARYDRAPHGYRRYSSRPHDWRARRCVAVGPLWFCP